MNNLLQRIVANLSHPEHGWKTTHFWGPIANWGIVLSAVYDALYKGPEIINIPMTATLAGYSSLFIRFAWKVKPRNYLLFSCHMFNIIAQVNQLRRAIDYKLAHEPDAKVKISNYLRKFCMLGVGIGAIIASSGKLQNSLTKNTMPDLVRKFAAHPAGVMTIFFWAPTSKWLLSANNFADLKRDTNKMSLSQQLALTVTGTIWARWSLVINPVNYNLSIVNLVLAVSSGYHLVRKIKADYFRN